VCLLWSLPRRAPAIDSGGILDISAAVDAADLMQIRLEIRDLERVRQLVWELRQLENRLRVAARPEGAELERITDRFLADIGADREEEEGPSSAG
jgi:uncharacterized protein YjiS (DUF1127 family)